jgi:hypothetical protein
MKVGDRVLTHDMTAGTIEELDEHGFAAVRTDSWAGLGQPSCCVEWADLTRLRPLPAGYVPPTHSPEEVAEAIAFGRAVFDALENAT